MLLAGEKEERLGNHQMDTDSRNRVYRGVENEKGYLVVVVEFAGTRRADRKSSPKSSPET
jgi:hypothetical protein